jgi:hypothetical protein
VTAVEVEARLLREGEYGRTKSNARAQRRMREADEGAAGAGDGVTPFASAVFVADLRHTPGAG